MSDETLSEGVETITLEDIENVYLDLINAYTSCLVNAALCRDGVYIFTPTILKWKIKRQISDLQGLILCLIDQSINEKDSKIIGRFKQHYETLEKLRCQFGDPNLAPLLFSLIPITLPALWALLNKINYNWFDSIANYFFIDVNINISWSTIFKSLLFLYILSYPVIFLILIFISFGKTDRILSDAGIPYKNNISLDIIQKYSNNRNRIINQII
jgi:hypothetical protein